MHIKRSAASAVGIAMISTLAFEALQGPADRIVKEAGSGPSLEPQKEVLSEYGQGFRTGRQVTTAIWGGFLTVISLRLGSRKD